MSTVLSLLSKTDDDEKDALIKALISKISVEENSLSSQEKENLLNEALRKYVIDHQFHIGEIVKWKPGLKNKKLPKHDEPAIVVELLHTPIENIGTTPASPYFKENLNIKLGIIMDNGEFFTFYYDKNRFEPLNSNSK